MSLIRRLRACGHRRQTTGDTSVDVSVQHILFSGTYGSASRGLSTLGNGFQRPYFACIDYSKINKALCLIVTINVLYDTKNTTRKKWTFENMRRQFTRLGIT